MTGQPLKIAMVVPPWFEVPPHGYGGIEAMCGDLIEGLIATGMAVTLIGAGTHGTGAQFVATYPAPQAARMGQALPEVVHAAALPAILAYLDVDVVHDHTLAGPLLAPVHQLPTVVTAHGPVAGELGDYYRYLADSVALVAISAAQRRAAPQLRWAGMVHNAIRVADYPYRADKEDFALFLGRLSPEKGLPVALEAAAAAGLPLVVAAKCREPAERDYYRQEIAPRLTGAVEWLGEVDQTRKRELLAAARCLLFPICWEEPFGLVMIEALACGTPVVALCRGSVPEVITHQETGLICHDPAELPAALHHVQRLDPARCRAAAEHRFDVATMTAGYEQLYRRHRHRLATPAAAAG